MLKSSFYIINGSILIYLGLKFHKSAVFHKIYMKFMSLKNLYVYGIPNSVLYLISLYTATCTMLSTQLGVSMSHVCTILNPIMKSEAQVTGYIYKHYIVG